MTAVSYFAVTLYVLAALDELRTASRLRAELDAQHDRRGVWIVYSVDPYGVTKQTHPEAIFATEAKAREWEEVNGDDGTRVGFWPLGASWLEVQH